MSGRYGNFNPDPIGLGEFMRTEPKLASHLEAVVGRMKDFAEAIAPVGPEGDPHRGEYKASFHTDVRVDKPFKGEPRLMGFITNDAPHAAAVEYGRGGRSKHEGDSPHHVMTRAIDAARGL